MLSTRLKVAAGRSKSAKSLGSQLFDDFMIAREEIDAPPGGAFSPRKDGGEILVPTLWHFLYVHFN